MPIWTNRPPTAEPGHSHRIRRTPADKPLTAICTSPELLGCATHFLSNRTVPCEGQDDCPHCADGHSWRWHGYLGAMDVQTLEHFIFEMTAAAADSLRNYMTIHGNLRGCYFQATRPNKRPNGRVVIACKRIDEQHHRLPTPLNVRKILCHIWNVRYDDTQQFYSTLDAVGRIDVKDSHTDGRYRKDPHAPN